MIEVKVLDDEGQKKYTNLMNFNLDNLARMNERKIKAAILRENLDSERSGRVNFSVEPPTSIPQTPVTTTKQSHIPSRFKVASPQSGGQVFH
jgi:hypothetical protein